MEWERRAGCGCPIDYPNSRFPHLIVVEIIELFMDISWHKVCTLEQLRMRRRIFTVSIVCLIGAHTLYAETISSTCNPRTTSQVKSLLDILQFSEKQGCALQNGQCMILKDGKAAIN